MVTTESLGDAGPMRRHPLRVTLLWLAFSVLLHALALLALPRAGERAVPGPEILRVTIEKSAPPRADTPNPRPSARAVAPAAKPQQEKTRVELPRDPPKAPALPRAPEAPPRDILALPQQPSASAPTVTVPSPEKPSEQPLDIAKAVRPAAPAESAAAAKPTPPRVSDAYVLESPVRYPRTAEQGRVTLKVLVNREGRVANVSMQKPSGFTSLDQHALEAVRRWRFAPARQGAETVEQWLTVNVDY